MKLRAQWPALACLAMIALIAGCAPSYVVTRQLERPLAASTTIRIGQILDEMPADTRVSDRPTSEDLVEFRTRLIKALQDREDELLLTVVGAEEPEASPAAQPIPVDAQTPTEASATPTCRYEISGSILGFKAGSGFLRFMVGFGAGSATVLTTLRVTDLQSGEQIFAGNFEGKVTSWAESGDEMYNRVAKDFVKELNKQSRGKGGGREPEPDSPL